MKIDGVLLEYMLECIEEIERFSVQIERPLENSLYRGAILHYLQLTGQSAIQLSAALQDRHPQVDWRGLRGFRNAIVHDYLGLDMERVASAIQQQLPILKAAVLAELKRAGIEPGSGKHAREDEHA